jgi:hypothetical protein
MVDNRFALKIQSFPEKDLSLRTIVTKCLFEIVILERSTKIKSGNLSQVRYIQIREQVIRNDIFLLCQEYVMDMTYNDLSYFLDYFKGLPRKASKNNNKVVILKIQSLLDRVESYFYKIEHTTDKFPHLGEKTYYQFSNYVTSTENIEGGENSQYHLYTDSNNQKLSYASLWDDVNPPIN